MNLPRLSELKLPRLEAWPRKRWIALGVAAAALLTLGGFVARVAAGPTTVGWLKPAVEHALEGQVRGGRAHIDRVRLVWFGEVNSLGLELTGARLTDARGREVLRARRAEAAVALDALASFKLTLGRVQAQEFFAAFSVSPQGKYQLGYEATGKPGTPARLDGLLGDLTGAPRAGRPISYFRQLDLKRGRLALRQVGGPVAWTADVRQVRFDKTRGRLNTLADVSLSDGRPVRPATLKLQGRAALGLSDAYFWARLQGLTPRRVFPSVGATRPLSTLDAVVGGVGSISYDLKGGVRAADVRLTAGQGALRMGDRAEDFQAAELVAAYDPKSQRVDLTSLKLFAEKTRLDLRGSLRLTPDDPRRKQHARLDWILQGPQLYASLSPDAPSQELTGVVAAGRYTPSARRFELSEAKGLLAGAPVTAKGLFVQDDKRRWSAKLDARMSGVVTPDQVFAFWPQPLVHDLRGWLRRAILGGRISNAVFAIDAAPGAFKKEPMRDEDLKISFDVADAGFRFAEEFPAITQGVAHGEVQGNQFALKLTSGRIDEVALSEGVIDIPRFKPHGQMGHFKVRATGEAAAVLRTLDGPKLQLMSKHGLPPSRVSGKADVVIAIDRPMLMDARFEDYKISYAGTVKGAGLTQAALGWDLTGGDLKVEGDQDKVEVAGLGTVGPYRGRVEFSTRYSERGIALLPRPERGQNIAIEGLVDAAFLGGRQGLSVPLAGKFRIADGVGAGVVHSPMFEGRVNWKPGEGRDRFSLDGWGGASALRKVGVPFLDSVPDRFATDLSLSRAGETWRGVLRADALSGNIAFTAGQKARLIYDAEISPLEARRMGLGRLPLFEQARAVLVDASWTGTQGAAQVKAGPVSLLLGWNRPTGAPVEHRLNANLSNADLTALGLPALVRPGVSAPVQATWRSSPDGASGSASVDGIPVRFTTAPVRGGATAYVVRADLDDAALHRLGAPDLLDITGGAAVSARWVSSEARPPAGRVEVDFARAALFVAHSDWKKPAGQAARVSADFVQGDGGDIRLVRIFADGAIDAEGSATVSGGRVTSLALSRVRLAGLVDGAMNLTRDANGVAGLSIRGKWLDARRLFDTLSASGKGGAASPQAPLRIDAQLDGLRLTDAATLHDVRAAGVFGPEATRRLDLTAATANGSRLKARMFPLAGGTAVAAEAADAGDLARTLFGVKSLKGGTGTLTGRLVPGGADLSIEMTNVRLVRAPTMAQILTLGSLRGLADTLNGEGILFNRVVAPVQIRGKRIIIGESRATGSALGFTTKGVADLGADTLDFQGSLTPMNGLNSAIGAVPVVGDLLTSRKGEGVVALGYSARGSFEKPSVMVNPLSLMTPGILRRVFEGPPPSTESAPRPQRPARRPPAQPAKRQPAEM